MTTVLELVTDALIDLGRFDPTETPDDTTLQHALRMLNRMIGAWSIENLLIPYTTSESFAVAAGTASYTMGAAGTASATRANRILDAYIRDSNGYDQPLDIINQRRYNNILNKSLAGRPDRLYYDPVYPVGTLYLYKVPDASYTAYIESTKLLHATMALDDTVSLEKSYENAIVLNLRNLLARSHGVQKTPDMIYDASEAVRKIKVLNSANRMEEMNMPAGVGGSVNPVSINEG